MYQTLTSRTEGRTHAVRPSATGSANPWRALWAMMVGFFMILLDATIVAVANPSIMMDLGADYDAVIWVTSAYLLGFAVPLLLAGRLGDQFGPKNLYVLGLAIFTAASLWCGLADSIEMLITARVVQGIGAAALTPQTLTTITRIFPAQRRGAAMALWGATAGVATLVGPLAGGVLVDALGWSWIFYVNVPVGLIGLALAVWLIPVLPTQVRRFDLPGVLLSGVGIFLIVFALQEGQSNDWAPWIWGTATIGLGFLAAFVYWQSVNNDEPLIPLRIFADRDFGLSTVGVATIGFVATSQVVPLMFYAQAVCGLSPTRSAVLIAPMAIASGVLAPLVGRIIDRSHPRPVIGFGFAVLAVALTWLSIEMTATTPIWRLVLPITAMGIGMAFIWSPLAATATRNLAPDVAGAGSGVYNATRQVGSVLGSAGIAAFLTFRVNAQMPAAQTGGPIGEAAVTDLPAALHVPFAAAMSQSMLLPAFLALFGVVAALFLLGFGDDRSSAMPAASPDDQPTEIIDVGELPPQPAYYAYSRGSRMPVGDDHDHLDDYVEDEFIEADEFDDYLEYTVLWDDAEPEPVAGDVAGDDNETEPIAVRAEQLMHVPADPWHKQLGHELREPPVPPAMPEEPDGLLDELLDKAASSPSVEPIGHAHNGFHVDDKKHFQPLPRPEPPPRTATHRAPDIADDTRRSDPLDFGHLGIDDRPGRHQLPDDRTEPGRHSSHGRHARDDPDEGGAYGRHSKPD